MFLLHAILIFALTGMEKSSALDSRELFIFGKELNEKIFKEQMDLLSKEDSAVKDRDIKITIVKTGSSLYQKYKVQKEKFTVILVGKDGTEKHRTHEVLQPAELFAIIDAMPMRKREMRKQ